MKHVVDDPKSTCDCRECWYMRGWNEAIARVRAAGAPEVFLHHLPTLPALKLVAPPRTLPDPTPDTLGPKRYTP